MKAYTIPRSSEFSPCLGENSKLNTRLSLCVSRIVTSTKGSLQFIGQKMPSFKATSTGTFQ